MIDIVACELDAIGETVAANYLRWLISNRGSEEARYAQLDIYTDQIDEMFLWSRTPQGHVFWGAVRVKLADYRTSMRYSEIKIKECAE